MVRGAANDELKDAIHEAQEALRNADLDEES